MCIQPKDFHAYFIKTKKKLHFYHALKKKYKNGYHIQFMIIY